MRKKTFFNFELLISTLPSFIFHSRKFVVLMSSDGRNVESYAFQVLKRTRVVFLYSSSEINIMSIKMSLEFQMRFFSSPSFIVDLRHSKIREKTRL